MTEEYVTYNGIPHRVLPPKEPEPKRDIIKDSLDLQRLILSNPEERRYIIGDENKEQKLVTRSAGVTAADKRPTVDKQLELQQLILGNF